MKIYRIANGKISKLPVLEVKPCDKCHREFTLNKLTQGLCKDCHNSLSEPSYDLIE